jgi:hypothetical protein
VALAYTNVKGRLISWCGSILLDPGLVDLDYGLRIPKAGQNMPVKPTNLADLDGKWAGPIGSAVSQFSSATWLGHAVRQELPGRPESPPPALEWLGRNAAAFRVHGSAARIDSGSEPGAGYAPASSTVKIGD